MTMSDRLHGTLRDRFLQFECYKEACRINV